MRHTRHTAGRSAEGASARPAPTGSGGQVEHQKGRNEHVEEQDPSPIRRLGQRESAALARERQTDGADFRHGHQAASRRASSPDLPCSTCAPRRARHQCAHDHAQIEDRPRGALDMVETTWVENETALIPDAVVEWMA